MSDNNISIYAHLYNGTKVFVNRRIYLSRVPNVGEFVFVSLRPDELEKLSVSETEGEPNAFAIVAVDHNDFETEQLYQASIWCKYLAISDHRNKTAGLAES